LHSNRAFVSACYPQVGVKSFRRPTPTVHECGVVEDWRLEPKPSLQLPKYFEVVSLCVKLRDVFVGLCDFVASSPSTKCILFGVHTYIRDASTALQYRVTHYTTGCPQSSCTQMCPSCIRDRAKRATADTDNRRRTYTIIRKCYWGAVTEIRRKVPSGGGRPAGPVQFQDGSKALSCPLTHCRGVVEGDPLAPADCRLVSDKLNQHHPQGQHPRPHLC
jgi:hypothetical protein